MRTKDYLMIAGVGLMGSGVLLFIGTTPIATNVLSGLMLIFAGVVSDD